MYISSIELYNWKAYVTAKFEFSEPTAKQNIVLIGAPNGYGKTSLFEAIVMGLFGRYGLWLIARSPFTGNETNRLTTSYSKFLKNALHKGALDKGDDSSWVKVALIAEDGRKIEIQRIWHFNSDGSYRINDEEILVYEGEGVSRKPVGPSGLRGSERVEWYHDYIAQTFLPHSLATFYMFDGEQVSAFAEREMADQVRVGIEGLLGIPILRQLAESLRKYARARLRETPDFSNKTLEKMESDIAALEEQCKKHVERRNEIEPDLMKLKEERDVLLRELASFGTGSHAQRQEQLERLNQYQRDIESERNQLEELLVKDIALALCGTSLRESLRDRLIGEDIRARWETSRLQGDNNLEYFLDAIDENIRLHVPPPSLKSKQRTSILNIVREAWEKLWHPPPENCADSYLHPYLGESERSGTIGKLDELENLGASGVVDLLDSIRENEKALDRLEKEIIRTEEVAPNIEEKRRRVETLNNQIQDLNQEYGSLRREIESLDSQIHDKNAKLTNMTSQLDQAKPSMRRATRARTIADMVDDIVTEAVPNQIAAIAKAMTAAYRAMSHKKSLVEQIVIDGKCDVQLLNAKKINVRDYDLSAGEKQIFTQALISAVSSVSGRRFPMIIDTPLGRLDTEHRKGVLQHLAKRKGQIILLSTNTEVVGRYLKTIKDNITEKYTIHFEPLGEIGEAHVRDGYFDEGEAEA